MKKLANRNICLALSTFLVVFFGLSTLAIGETGTFTIPLPGLIGSLGSRTTTFDFEMNFVSIQRVSIQCSGTITPGWGCGDGVELPEDFCFDWDSQIEIYMDPGPGAWAAWIGPCDGSFSVNKTFQSLGPATWNFLLDGQAQISASIAPMIVIGGVILEVPTATITEAYLTVEGVQEVWGDAAYYVDVIDGNDLNDGLSWETAFATIQRGINETVNGESVTVAEGTYYENISFGGKIIAVRSTDPNDPDVVANTIIDGGGVDTVVRFNGTETSDCKLLGFTITNGYGPADGDGGGITGASTSATVANCIISDNIAQRHGGGIRGVNGLIDRCIITGNSTVNRNAGGITGCHGTISNCLIYDNTATLSGGGIVNCDGDIVNCTIVDNTAGTDTGGIGACDGTITNCIIWGNNLEQITVSSTPTYSCIQDWSAGGTGNIDADPNFAAGPLGDYYLSQTAAGQDGNSLCVDAGSDTSANLGMDILTTRTDQVVDEGIVDMGYHYQVSALTPLIGVEPYTLDFFVEEYGVDPDDQVLSVWNDGTGTLHWTIEENWDKLTVTPDSGSSSGEVNAVVLSMESSLPQGIFTYDFTVSDPNAPNSPQTVTVNLINECIFDDSSMYDDWVGVGKPWYRPDCWCYERQCRGDADGCKVGLFWIQTADLEIFASAYNVGDAKLDQTKICADFDHKKVGVFRVQTNDLIIFSSFLGTGPLKLPLCPLDWEATYEPGNYPNPGTPDGQDDYNFWIVPTCP